jgi:hypothetical protein
MDDFLEDKENNNTDRQNDHLIEKWNFSVGQLRDFESNTSTLVYSMEGGIYASAPRQKDWYVPAGKIFFIPANLPVHLHGKKNGSLVICPVKEIDLLENKDIVMAHADRSIRIFFPDFLMNYECGLKCETYLKGKLDELLFLVRKANPHLFPQ